MPIQFHDKVIAGTVTSGSVTFEKSLPHNHGYSIHAKWAGTGIVGLLKLQASLDGTSFIDISDSTENFSDTGEVMWDISEANYNWLKIICTSTSGAVSFEVWLTLKRDSGIR